MRFRKPRIAWSVFWGVACVLLIVLWVRSYWWSDRGYFFTPGNIFAIESDYGVLGLVHKTDETIRLNGRILDWQLFSNPRRKDTPEGEAFLRDTYKAYPRILGRFPAAFRVQI